MDTTRLARLLALGWGVWPRAPVARAGPHPAGRPGRAASLVRSVSANRVGPREGPGEHSLQRTLDGWGEAAGAGGPCPWRPPTAAPAAPPGLIRCAWARAGADRRAGPDVWLVWVTSERCMRAQTTGSWCVAWQWAWTEEARGGDVARGGAPPHPSPPRQQPPQPRRRPAEWREREPGVAARRGGEASSGRERGDRGRVRGAATPHQGG